jgi:hypothetical protein
MRSRKEGENVMPHTVPTGTQRRKPTNAPDIKADRSAHQPTGRRATPSSTFEERVQAQLKHAAREAFRLMGED